MVAILIIINFSMLIILAVISKNMFNSHVDKLISESEYYREIFGIYLDE